VRMEGGDRRKKGGKKLSPEGKRKKKKRGDAKAKSGRGKRGRGKGEVKSNTSVVYERVVYQKAQKQVRARDVGK